MKEPYKIQTIRHLAWEIAEQEVLETESGLRWCLEHAIEIVEEAIDWVREGQSRGFTPSQFAGILESRRRKLKLES